MSEHYLKKYLQDHFAGSQAGLSRFRQAARRNRGTALGAFLLQTTEEVREDRAALLKVLRALGGKPALTKTAFASAGERASRLKLDLKYDPLSRMEDLEGLFVAVTAKLEEWRVLKMLARTDSELQILDYDALIERAQKQRRGLERFRKAAAREAFSRTRPAEQMADPR
ncbi:MAG: hypothetical protein ACJ790_22680 [Myxococcaceae bacterium]